MDFADYLRFLFALAFVLALIGGAAWLVRRIGLGGLRINPPVSERRLAVVETLQLDPRRRLVLIRRDDIEHLVLMGQSHETLIETWSINITAASVEPPPPTKAPPL